MAESLDVAARLAEGRAAVDNIGEYVWGCHLVGYQNPDLTLHAAQVRDWYGSEDGLDLQALETDRAALDAAATATDSALRLQEQQLGTLAVAWQGRGGDASHQFLIRHGEASAAVASAVRNAVHALAALRDDLWHAVDDKVGAAMAIEQRRQTERAEWLAAVRTVTAGAGDRAVASELIDQQVKPFVDNDIRSDWLTAMQKAMAAVSAAFDDATRVLTDEPAAPFEVPGDLGPVSIPSPPSTAPTAEVTGTAPAAWSSPPAAASAPGAGANRRSGPSDTRRTRTALGADAGSACACDRTPACRHRRCRQCRRSVTRVADYPAPQAASPASAPNSPTPLAVSSTVPTMRCPIRHRWRTRFSTTASRGPLTKNRWSTKAATMNRLKRQAISPKAMRPPSAADEPADACAEKPVDETPAADPVSTPPQAPLPPPQPIVEPPPSDEAIGAETPCEIAADELPQAGP